MNHEDAIRSLHRDVESLTRATRTVRSDMVATANQVVTERDATRQAIEDRRANHRNFNRLLTLLVAWALTFAVTYAFQNGLPAKWGWMSAHEATRIAPYSFFIIISLDAILALYGMWKRY